MRIGLGYADDFCSVHSHSGAVSWGTAGGALRQELLNARGPEFTAELEKVFGPEPCGSDHDLLTLAKNARDLGVLPALHLDCGVDDYLIEDNRRLVAAFTEEEIPHVYLEKPGAHDWDYWDRNIARALDFHCAQLKVSPII